MGGPVWDGFRVYHEKLAKKVVVVKDQLVDDVRVAQMRSAVHAWEKPGCHERHQV